MRILQLITSLGVGGAEAQVVALSRSMCQAGHAVEVVSLLSGGENAERLRHAGIPVTGLGMRRGFPHLFGISRLRQLIDRFRPNIVQSWLYHADLLATLSLVDRRSPALVWNLRGAALDARQGQLTKIVSRMLAFASPIPDAVIANSEAGKSYHEKIGYRPREWAVIPNIVDTDLFCPSIGVRASVRAELGIPYEARLVGLVARFDSIKDHRTFCQAASLLGHEHPKAHFLMIGPGVDTSNPFIREWLPTPGSISRFHLLGQRNDMPRLQAALDVAVCSSVSEGLPNSLIEAMSCGVPCVSTDVGDAQLLLDEGRGIVVPSRDPSAMAKAIRMTLEMPGDKLKVLQSALRKYVIEMFSGEGIASAYSTLYEKILGRSGRDGRCAE